MKIKCNICKRVFEYPFEINNHRHEDCELDGVPINFWDSIYNDGEVGFDIDPKQKGVFQYKSMFTTPIIKNISLGEGNTKLTPYKNNVYIKNEATNPTGSFKDRGMPLLMNEALFYGKSEIAIVSTGNAAISMIEYAKAYGLKSTVFVPKNLSNKKIKLLKNADKVVFCEDIIKSFKNQNVFNGYLTSNLSYLQGLESITYEIYSELKYLPDYIIIPCASGGNIVAQARALEKLKKLGLANTKTKIVCVQISGGDPIYQGVNQGEEKLFVIDNPIDSKTILSSDTCFNYPQIARLVRQNVVVPLSINDSDIENVQNYQTNLTAIAGIACYNKYIKIFENKKVVIIATAK